MKDLSSFLFILSLFLFSWKASGNKIQRQEIQSFSGEEINFSSSRSVRVEIDKTFCPIDFYKQKSCFHKDYKRNVLVLDPGHELGIGSLRNGRHDEVHEGRSNMVVAILAKLMLQQCIGYEEQTQTGFKTNNIFLSYYPGEQYYGEYIYGSRSNRIRQKGGDALFNHINKLLKLKGNKAQNSTVISVHADSPNYSTELLRQREFPAVYFRKVRRSSAILATEMYKSLIDTTSKYYKQEQLQIFLPVKIDATKIKYPLVTLAGLRDGRRTFKIDDNYYDFRTWQREVAQVMRVGKAWSLGNTTNLTPKVNNTEVVLLEGYFMDSLGVGGMIQRELEAPNAMLMKLSYTPRKSSIFTPLNFKKAKVNITGTSGNYIRYSITDSGITQRGLKYTDFHIDYAKSIVLGLIERYKCIE